MGDADELRCVCVRVWKWQLVSDDGSWSDESFLLYLCIRLLLGFADCRLRLVGKPPLLKRKAPLIVSLCTNRMSGFLDRS